MNFEKFITDRFLDFYNKRTNTNFVIKEKVDEKERNRAIYDFSCIDLNTESEMAVELKRLFSERNTHLKQIKDLIHTYINEPLKNKILGQYYLLIKGFESPFKLKNKLRSKLLNEIKDEIASLNFPVDSYELKCRKGITLAKCNENGSSIIAWPVDFSSASKNEIVRILDSCLKKFDSIETINIILLIELSSTTRDTEIRSIIENLKYGIEPNNFNSLKRDFSNINGIYHIGITRKNAVIAQVGPNDQNYATTFFSPSEFINDINKMIQENLL